MNEKELISRARKRDHNAFKELVKKYEQLVAATVISMLGYCPEAEDVGQETFIRLYRSLGKFREESSVGTYLTRIAINLSLNELKRRQRQRNLFRSKPENTIEQLPAQDRPIQNNELKEIIHTGLQKLDAKHRAVLVLRLIDGYSTQETAEILNLPVGTVLSRLARAQMKMKDILSPVYFEKNKKRGEGNG